METAKNHIMEETPTENETPTVDKEYLQEGGVLNISQYIMNLHIGNQDFRNSGPVKAHINTTMEIQVIKLATHQLSSSVNLKKSNGKKR